MSAHEAPMTSVGRHGAFDPHDPEGGVGNLLVQQEHQCGSEDRLKQLRLQAFKQSQHAPLPAVNQSTNMSV